MPQCLLAARLAPIGFVSGNKQAIGNRRMPSSKLSGIYPLPTLIPSYRSMPVRFDDPPLPPSNLPISLLPVLVSFLADVSRFFARPPRITNPGHQFIPLPRRRLTNRILTSNFELSRTLKPPRPQRSPLRPLLYTYRYTRHEYTHYIYINRRFNAKSSS